MGILSRMSPVMAAVVGLLVGINAYADQTNHDPVAGAQVTEVGLRAEMRWRAAPHDLSDFQKGDFYFMSANRYVRDDVGMVGGRDLAMTSFNEARAHFGAVVDKDPQNHVAWNRLGDCNKRLERWDEAAVAYQKAIALNPYDANAHMGLAGVYYHSQRYSEALPIFEKAMEVASQVGDQRTFENSGLFVENISQRGIKL